MIAAVRDWNPPGFYARQIGARPDWVIAEARAGRLKASNLARPGAKKARFLIHRDDWDAFMRSRTVTAPKPATPRRRSAPGVIEYV